MTTESSEEKGDHIKIATADDDIRKVLTTSRGLNLRKTFSRERSRDHDRSDIESTYDEAFEAPRGVDFRHKQVFKGWPLLLLAYQSTGVIYGDIGTSPLYVYSSTFQSEPIYEDLLGALSLIIWTLTLIVTIKYVVIVLNADNEGQGGTFAMYSLLTRYSHISTAADPSRDGLIRIERHLSADFPSAGGRSLRTLLERSTVARYALSLIACFGVSLIMADGVLTPAQSILGSVQGLTVINPSIGKPAIIGITCGILIVLFSIQPLGVAKIGILFAPIVITWLLFNFCFGVYNLVHHDHSVLKAFSPYFAGLYFVRNKTQGWKSLGGILLAFTGVEALFADLGAFSKRAIQLSWLCLAFPCLLMAYIGQAAFISRNPGAYSNPFFNCAPPGLFWPSFVISILATIVASQALITSTFQLLFQVINSSYFPPISYRYTSIKYHSQIYIPTANFLLMVGTIVVTAVFKDTTKLGNAYGVCVILDTVVTTTLVSLVAVIVWRVKWYAVLPIWLVYALFEGLYLSSALTKVPDGAWFTLGLAVCLAIIFTMWRLGKEQQWAVERKGRMRLNRLISKDPSNNTTLTLNPGLGGGEIITTKGVGIFFDKPGGADFVPVVYEEFLRKFEAQPAIQIFLHLRATTVPFVPEEERYAVTRTGLPNCYRMIIRYGYSEQAVSPQLGRVVYDELKKYIVGLGKRPMPSEGATPALSSEPSTVVESASVSEEEGNGTSSAVDTHNSAMTKAEDGSRSNSGRNRTNIDVQITQRLATLDAAHCSQTIYVFGKEELVMPEKRYNIFKRFFLGVFLWMRDSTAEKVTSLRIPTNKIVEIGFVKEI